MRSTVLHRPSASHTGQRNGGTRPSRAWFPRPCTGFRPRLVGLHRYRYGLGLLLLLGPLCRRNLSPQRQDRAATAIQNLQHPPMPGIEIPRALVEPEIIAWNTVGPAG